MGFFVVEYLLIFINYQQNALINYYFEFLFLCFRRTSSIGYCFEFFFYTPELPALIK